MTTKNTLQENGGSWARPTRSLAFGPPATDGPADLDAVCRSVAELARSSPKPPSRIRLQHGGTTVEMEWPDQPATAPAAGTAPPPPVAEDDGALGYLCAPMVGTFYHAREPGAPPLVAVGDLVVVGQPVGILEVMKMMSTVEADVAGRVVGILTPDATAVEFQQRLIALEPVPTGEDA
ncbi:acetyl-CoA carboxylase biotin carboxyl carrier protein subunit [Kitasatospora sp. NBC_00070]|uniref:acetyl-CoA carboxylase biotin carboxyl carrier protein n=1 Tax=Kitasatospora sp. NBC_00070 TaxID=2975962 RepID=UPI00324CB45E